MATAPDPLAVHAQTAPDRAAVVPMPEAMELLVDLYRQVAGEHPDWDDFRRSMVADGRLLVRLRPDRAYGMLPQ